MDNAWSPNMVIAAALWAIGAGFIALDLFVPKTDDVGHVGLAVFLLGKVFHDRELCRQQRARERAAYDAGREVGIQSIR